MFLRLFILVCFTLSIHCCCTHEREQSQAYIWPKDEEVLEKLDKWQDQKFGILIHWGLYSYHGVVESWLICSEEEDWIGRDSTKNYEEFKREYWGAIDHFNPVNFNPKGWAEMARRAGVKYVVFTTKHHDGFCMFDTKQTDFSIMNGPFGSDPRANVAKEVFDAFSAEGMMTGAYFSKPDWHSQYYWWDRYATPNRNNNYDIDKNPWRWEKFKEYTYNQIEEIVGGEYGPIDILWLDGGWVRPEREGDRERMGKQYKGEQDIDIPRLASMARGHQPGMIIVDRDVHGVFENYRTPERGIPEEKLDYPWESNIPLGNDWGYVPTDVFKSPEKVVSMLVEIVAKGGNMVLGVGPKPDGTLPEDAVWRLERIGEWLSANGDAIYGTRPVEKYRDSNVWFTATKEAERLFAIVCADDSGVIPASVKWRGYVPVHNGQITSLADGQKVDCKVAGDAVQIELPQSLRGSAMPVVLEIDIH